MTAESMFEEDYPEEYGDPSEEDVCSECEHYQQRINELNFRLREELTESQYQATRRNLEDAVQIQFCHQRKHC